MEDGIRGNQEQDGDAIAASGQDISDLSDKLVELLDELDQVTGYSDNVPDDNQAAN